MSLLRLTAGLALVCVVCVAAARFLGKPKAATTGGMELLASLPVDPRCVVHLVRAGGRRLLIGTDDAGVKVLVELPGPEPEPTSPPEPAATEPVVVGPVTVPAPQPSRDEILALLAKLRAGDPPDAPSPG